MVPIWVHAWLILLSTVYLKNFAILEYNFIPITYTFLDEKTVSKSWKSEEQRKATIKDEKK